MEVVKAPDVKLRVKTKPVKNIINVDYDLMLVFGYYLAEGNVTDNDCLRFTFSQDEKEICKDVISIIKDKFRRYRESLAKRFGRC